MMRQQPGEGHHFWEQLSLTRVPVTASSRVPFPSETSFSAWPSSWMEADSMGLSYETLIRNIHRRYYESWILFMELNLDFELWHIFSMSIKLALTSMRKECWHLVDLKQKAEIAMRSAWTLLCGFYGFASMLHYICHLISPPMVTVLVSLSLEKIIECDINGSVR